MESSCTTHFSYTSRSMWEGPNINIFSLSSIFSLQVIATIIETNTKKSIFQVSIFIRIYRYRTDTEKISVFFGMVQYRKIPVWIFRFRYIPKNIGMDFGVSVYTEKIPVWIFRFRYIPKNTGMDFQVSVYTEVIPIPKNILVCNTKFCYVLNKMWLKIQLKKPIL